MARKTPMKRGVTLLMYDIPTKSSAENPCGILRRRGVKLNLSVWALFTDMIPWAALNKMTGQSVDWDAFEFFGLDARALHAVALKRLKSELEAAEVRQDAALQSINEKLAASEADPRVSEPMRRVQRLKWQGKREAILNRTEELLRELEEGARNFDMDVTDAVSVLSRRVGKLRSLSHVRAAMVEDVAARVEQKVAHGKGLAEAIREDRVPALGIALDALEDEGVDVQADRLLYQSHHQAPSGSGNGKVAKVTGSKLSRRFPTK